MRERTRRSLLAVVMIVSALLLVGLPASSQEAPPPESAPITDAEWAQTFAHRLPVLVCIRSTETPGRRIPPFDDGYYYRSTNGFHGAYQFVSGTWAGAVSTAGFPLISGALPETIPDSMMYQDLAALALYHARGLQPWPTANRVCR